MSVTLTQTLSDVSTGVTKKTRVGVYGVAMRDGKMLVVRQKAGPYAGKLDFPGGGIEFGESAEEALRREFAEEVAMRFVSLQIIDNLTATVDVPSCLEADCYIFFQIGLLYSISGLHLIEDRLPEDMPSYWIDLRALSEHECSKLLWKYIIKNNQTIHE